MDDKELEMLQRKLDEFMAQENSRPRSEMDNLSPNDMSRILYQTFEDNSPIRLKTAGIKEEVMENIPFLKLMFAFLNKLNASGEMKLTPKGNLPRKWCLELYNLGIIKEEAIEKGIVKLNKEGDRHCSSECENHQYPEWACQKTYGEVVANSQRQKTFEFSFKTV